MRIDTVVHQKPDRRSGRRHHRSAARGIGVAITLLLISLPIARGSAESSSHSSGLDTGSPAHAAIERHVAWLGGWERLEALADITLTGKLTGSGLSGSVEVQCRRDGSIRSEFDLGAFRGGMTITPKDAYTLNMSGQPEALGEGRATEERRNIARVFGLHLRGEEVVITYEGTLERDNRSWEDLRFAYPNGDTFDLLLDPNDGRVEWQRSVVDNEESWIHLTDWREIEGLHVPFRQETTRANPTENELVEWETIRINTGIPDERFTRPGRAETPIRIASGTATDFSRIDLFRDRYIYLRGRVNGVPTEFLLDSGAGMTVLDRAFAEELELELQGEVAAEGAGGNSTASMVPGVRLEVAGLVADSLTVAVIDLAAVGRMLGRSLPVIFGKEVFNNFIVDLDYPQRRIRFLDPSTFRYQGEGQRVPIFPMEEGHREIEAQIEDLAPTRFHLDTGNGGTIDIFGPYAEENRMLDARSPISERLRGGVGGRTTWKVATLRSVTVGGFVLTNVPTLISSEGGDSGGTRRLAGSLGSGILSRFRVTFDYPSECLYLEPGSGWDDGIFKKDRSGLSFQLAGDSLDVIFVSPGSPAAKAGLKPGDTIVAIDGEPIDPEHYWTEIGGWNSAEAGVEVTLTLARGEVRRLTLADYY